jgi:hypothetical protein
VPPSTIQSDKELAIGFQPVLLATFTFRDASVLRLSTHPLSAATGVQYDGNDYEPRLLEQNLEAIQRLSASGIDLVSSVRLRMADADGFLWQNFEVADGKGFAGAELQLDLVLWEVGTSNFSSDSKLKFLGVCEPADSDNEILVVESRNRFDLNKVILPRVRIQKRCPWPFPRTAEERLAAANDSTSPFFACGYSPDAGGGNARGNDDPSTMEPFTDCGFTFDDCVARLGDSSLVVNLPSQPHPPISKDESGRLTGNFGGIQWEPPGSTRSRAVGKPFEQIESASNEARYNDFVPVLFGRAWVEPPVINVVRDANLTGLEVILSEGLCEGLTSAAGKAGTRVVVNDVEMFEGNAGGNEIAGFWNVINDGRRNGHPNIAPLYGARGDPYGGYAAILIVVPRQLADSPNPPRVRVLLKGRRVRVYTDAVTFTEEWTDNLVWVLAAMLDYSGLTYDRMNIDTLIAAAAIANETVDYMDLNGLARAHARFKANMVL